eukprot:TRINITY_DN16996_c0_g1_i19.p5 TRINITY_DN16996_c0_g1~~TRINITY_DN16996_c0_g1_i19.p5  ORF type:complete len:111 (-),score=0.52 TRINITY_DN16996_c0_g1_i19:329-661(-)
MPQDQENQNVVCEILQRFLVCKGIIPPFPIACWISKDQLWSYAARDFYLINLIYCSLRRSTKFLNNKSIQSYQGAIAKAIELQQKSVQSYWEKCIVLSENQRRKIVQLQL